MTAAERDLASGAPSAGAVDLDGPRVREPWLASGARALVHGITAGVFAWPLTMPSAVAAAALGAAVGAVLGRLVAGSRFRLWAIVAGGVALLGLVVAGLGALGRSAFVADALGPVAALETTETAVFGLGALVVSTVLRAASARRPVLAAVEVGAIALAFAQLVVAHRHGSINRPFAIADRILSEGGDPTSAILSIGVAAALVMALYLLAERRVLRSLASLLVAALLLGGVAALVRTPEPPDALGLRASGGGKEDQRRKDQRDGRGGGHGDANRPDRRTADDLEFRDEYEQPRNRVPVAVVLFHDDYSSPTGTYYFRQTAFSQFNGRRLVSAMDPGLDRDVQAGFPLGPVDVPQPPPPGPDRVDVSTTVALMASHPDPIGLEAPVALAPAPNPNPSRFRRLYTVESMAMDAGAIELLGRDVGDPRWDPETRDHYLEIPDDPRYGELADRIVADVLPEDLQEDPIARAVAVTSYLGKKGTYSLRSQHADATDPTGHFLFGDLTGYCVHFAHAATYLMRSLGIPSRVAAGYAVPESNRRGGSALVLTSSDAHAWPEIFIDEVGWVGFDVAVENVVSTMPPPPDPDLQRLLGELARGEDPLPVDGQQGPSLATLLGRALGTLGRVALVAALGALLFLYGAKLARRLAPRFAPASSQPRLAYRAVLDALSDVDQRRRFGESREAFARRLAETVPSLDGLTRLHLAARFGGPAASGDGVGDDARRLAQAARAELRRRVPGWRRLAGSLVPWTWLRVR